MPYTPPPGNAVNVDLKPEGSAPVIVVSGYAIQVDLGDEDGAGGTTPGEASDNARLRNFSILLAI